MTEICKTHTRAFSPYLPTASDLAALAAGPSPICYLGKDGLVHAAYCCVCLADLPRTH